MRRPSSRARMTSDGVTLVLERLSRRRASHTARTSWFECGQGGGASGAARAITCSSPPAARRTSTDLDLPRGRRGGRQAPASIVDDRLRTSNPRIYAAGDVCSPFKFTHAADAMARIVVQNALFFGRARASGLVIPWCTYTDPRSPTSGGMRTRRGGRGTASRRSPSRSPTSTGPSWTRSSTASCAFTTSAAGCSGCTVVSSRAGEMIGVPTHALTHGASLNDFGATIHPYPTLTNAFRAAGDVYRRSRLTPRVRALLKQYFRML